MADRVPPPGEPPPSTDLRRVRISRVLAQRADAARFDMYLYIGVRHRRSR
jgi:hypothetical protein